MRNLTLTLFVALFALCGCAHQYLLKLTDGDQILSATKPNLQGTTYHFTDETGAKYVIPKNRVTRIRPVSVVKEEPSAPTRESPTRPKKPRHWYFLWLA